VIKNKYTIRDFFRRTAFKTNVLAALILLFCYLSAWVHPKYFWPISLTGILFPLFFLVNLFFVIFWIVARKRHFILSLLVIAIGFNFVVRYFQVSFQGNYKHVSTTSTIKILSFNVRLFNLYKWVKIDNAQEEIIRFIQRESPDVICLQEFYTREKGKYNEKKITSLFPGIKYKYVRYVYRNKGVSNFGIVTFSKYPIIESHEIPFPNSYNQCIYTDIKVGKDTFRIYNTHLQSFRFHKRNFEFIDSLRFQHNPNKLNGFRDIFSRVKTAVVKRANQADSVSASIARSKFPVIVCGDFNDSPVSYSYQKISHNLKDAFIESGSGLSNTYISKFPSFRIDYILHSKELIAYNYTSPKLKLSDHNPVICFISKKHRQKPTNR